MHTHPFTHDVLQNCPSHIMKCCYHASLIVQDVTNGDLYCHKYMMTFKDLKPDVIVERYLDVKYYQYDPEEIYEMCAYNSSAKYLADSDQIVTLNAVETEESSMLASLHDNLQ